MKKKKSKSILIKPKLKENGVKLHLLDQFTTIHGVRHITSNKKVSSRVWLYITITNFFATVAFLFIAKQRLNSEIIVTKIFSDFSVRNVPFPAVSICNFNLVSARELQIFQKILNENGKGAEAARFFRDLPALRRFRINNTDIFNNTEVLKILKRHYFNVQTIMEDVHQKCEDLLVYCEFNKKHKNCNDIFRLTLTMEGFCCTFNYVAITKDDDSLLPEDADFEYYYDQGTDEKVATRIITTGQSGRTSGLRVVFNVEPNDYTSETLISSHGAKVMISDPNDYPETSVSYRYVHMGESIELKVAPLVFQSDFNLRELPPERRGLGCLFSDEVDLLNTNRYSYETCKTECKVANYVKLCGCVPYKYPKGDYMRVCEFEDLPCLHNVTVYAKHAAHCDPPCFMECRDKSYTMTSDLVPFLSEEWPERVTKNRNVSELASLQVYFGKPTCHCYKQSLLIDFNTAIATYGGMFSLSFGGSLITFYEIMYLLVSWSIKKLRNYFVKYNERFIL